MNRPPVPESVPVLLPSPSMDSTGDDRVMGVAHHADRGTDAPASATSLSHHDEPLRQIGPYRLLRRLGEGGMSSVYLAYDADAGLHVAVKVLADHLAHERQFVQRFFREANMSRMLEHPNIVKGFAIGQDPTSRRHYLVLEYVDGPSLQRILDDQGLLQVGAAVRAILDVARAVDYLHEQNYVHRDIKPGNILLDPTGQAKLIDLGLAKHLEQTIHLTMSEQGLGTSYYMPFEQAKNPSLVDGRSDIFALGATLYHLVTGEVPFPGLDHIEIAQAKERGEYLPASRRNPAVPAILDEILSKMLARDPRHRYDSAKRLIADLEASQLADFSPPSLSLSAEDLKTTDPGDLAATRVDLPLVCPIHSGHIEDSPAHAVWSLRYRRANGKWLTHQASTQQIIDWSEAGLLPSEVFVARSNQQQYRPLRAYPEFRSIPDGAEFTVDSPMLVQGPLCSWLVARRLKLVLTMGLTLFLGMLALLFFPRESTPGNAIQQHGSSLEQVPSIGAFTLPEPVAQQCDVPEIDDTEGSDTLLLPHDPAHVTIWLTMRLWPLWFNGRILLDSTP